MNHRCAALFLLLLPAACSGAAPKKEDPPVPPAEIFRKIEQQLLASSSLRIHARCERIKREESGTETRMGLTAVCLLRGENQGAVQIRGVDSEGKPVTAGVISDGSRMICRPQSDKPVAESNVPDSFKIVFQTMLPRFGLTATVVGIARMIGENAFPSPSELPGVKNVRGEETKDGVACMAYTVVDITTRETHAKLWYDAKTLKPQRFRVGVEDGKPGLIWEETYEDYALDAQIPDVSFVLPDPDPAGRRRFAFDGESMIYEEREAGVVRFVLISDGGTEGNTTDDGIILRRGGSTKTIKSTTGMMLIKGNRTMMNAIPAGWDHDLVQEYYEYRAAHPKGLIVDWLKAAQKSRPSPMMETYLRQE